MHSGVARPFLHDGGAQYCYRILSMITYRHAMLVHTCIAFIKSCCLHEKCIALATNSSTTNVKA